MAELPPWVADWWKPMESAPKDGEPILVYIGDAPNGDVMTVFYGEPDKDAPSHCWHRIDGLAYHRDAPRFWMPVPPAPRVGPVQINR